MRSSLGVTFASYSRPQPRHAGAAFAWTTEEGEEHDDDDEGAGETPRATADEADEVDEAGPADEADEAGTEDSGENNTEAPAAYFNSKTMQTTNILIRHTKVEGY